MSKTNDTTKTRELTEAELAAVSGAAIIVFDDEATPFRAGGTGKAGPYDRAGHNHEDHLTGRRKGPSSPNGVAAPWPVLCWRSRQDSNLRPSV
jgi:hypothetical protein